MNRPKVKCTTCAGSGFIARNQRDRRCDDCTAGLREACSNPQCGEGAILGERFCCSDCEAEHEAEVVRQTSRHLMLVPLTESMPNAILRRYRAHGDYGLAMVEGVGEFLGVRS